MSYLVDTDWIVDFLKGQTGTVQILSQLAPEGLAISLITYGEIYEGIYYGQNPERNEQDFITLLRGLDVLPLSQAIMREFARIRGQLRGQGLIIGDLDILIAATARQHQLTLLTRNVRHFSRIPGLQLYESD